MLPGTCEPLEGAPMPDEPSPLTIVFKTRGPYHIHGAVEIRDQDGNLVPQPVAKVPGIVKLCGCGHSKTKPFCDGTHKTLPDAPGR